MKFKTLETYNADEKELILGGNHLFGKVPNKIESKTLAKINKYLSYRNRKVYEAVKEKDFDKAVMIWLIMLKTSFSYQLYLAHSCNPKWYIEKSEKEQISSMKDAISSLRSWRISSEMRRFYVLKSKEANRQGMVYIPGETELRENEKLRPIGCPNLTTSMISKAITEMITFMMDPFREEVQHGYRPRKGVHTAIMDVIKKYKGQAIEFDMRSFFNKVPQRWIYETLNNVNHKISSMFFEFIWNCNYKFKNLEPEKELKFLFNTKLQGMKKKKPYLYRSGLPQGLSCSPLISTLALEWVGYGGETVMYADDGIFFGTPEEFEKWRKNLESWGMHMAEEKTKIVGKQVRFLGTEIDFERRIVKTETQDIEFDDPNIESKLCETVSKYGKKRTQWTWTIKEGSTIERVRIEEAKIDEEDLRVLKEEGQRKDLKRINGNIYSITRSSSWSLEILAKGMKSLTYEPIRPFKFSIFHINESPHQTVQEKQNHVEVWNNSDVIAGRSLWSGSMRLNHIVKKNSQERDHYVNDVIRETSYKEYLTNRNISHDMLKFISC
jgi:hypothetical protein